MRGNRKCGTCLWFEDHSEDFRARYVDANGLCHWRMPATVAKDSPGWGSWHQKGPAGVRKEDWCSCWQVNPLVHLEVGNAQIEIAKSHLLNAVTNGDGV